MKFIDLTGQTFARLTVLYRADGIGGRSAWCCVCKCGGYIEVTAQHLRRGSTTSCGCARKTHGLSGTPVYKVWASMRERCNNPNAADYPYYGGRGIAVCARWDDFELFSVDMGPRPLRGTIDRRNNARGYEPSNCSWVSPEEQRRNTRHNRLLTVKGKTMLLVDWARRLGANDGLVADRIRRGWIVEQACLTPVGQKPK